MPLCKQNRPLKRAVFCSNTKNACLLSSDFCDLLRQSLLFSRRLNALHSHHFAHVAFNFDLTAHETLHCSRLILFNEKFVSKIFWYDQSSWSTSDSATL